MQDTDHDQPLSGANRARWLAELDQALAEARALIVELSREPSMAGQTAILAQCLEHAIGEVAALRRRRFSGIQDIFGPKWLENSPERFDEDF